LGIPLKKIQILLIEDNRLLREGISAMLKKQADMHVVATIGNGENILQMLGKLNPDIVLLVIKSIISYNIST
jgi:DNA-binding NarL/FixJ family response regulator